MNVETSAEPTLEEAILTPGEYLRQAREKYGLSVEDVATELNLTVAQICSLEDNRFGDLPGKTYILGYMKAYARLVNCEEAELFRNFDLHEDVSISGIKPVMRQPRNRGHYKKLFSLLVIAIAGGLMFMWWQSKDKSEFISLEAGPGQQQDVQTVAQGPTGIPLQAEISSDLPLPATGQSAANGTAPTAEQPGVVALRTAAEPDPETQSIKDQLQAQIAAEEQSRAQDRQRVSSAGTDVTAPDIGGTSEQTQPAEIAVVEPHAISSTPPGAEKKPASEAGRGRAVMLEFSATSWVDLRDADGQRLLYENVNQGRQVAVEGQPPFSVFLGNAGGVAIEYDGEPFDFSAFTNGVYARFELGTQYKIQPDR